MHKIVVVIAIFVSITVLTAIWGIVFKERENNVATCAKHNAVVYGTPAGHLICKRPDGVLIASD